MRSIKALTIIPTESEYNIGRYVTFLAGAGLTTASFLVSGGTLALLGSGIMCGAGLQLSLKSLKEITKNTENESWNKSVYDISLGALNGLISSIGLACIAQNQCNNSMNENVMTDYQQLISYYAFIGFITGTINGTINEVINLKQSNNYRITSTNIKNDIRLNNNLNNTDIELLNIGKSCFMEMGSNMITAIGKSTLFKSANDVNMDNIYVTRSRAFDSNQNIFQREIHRQPHAYYDRMQQSLNMQIWNLKRYKRNFSNILTIRKSQKQKQLGMDY